MFGGKVLRGAARRRPSPRQQQDATPFTVTKVGSTKAQQIESRSPRPATSNESGTDESVFDTVCTRASSAAYEQRGRAEHATMNFYANSSPLAVRTEAIPHDPQGRNARKGRKVSVTSRLPHGRKTRSGRRARRMQLSVLIGTSARGIRDGDRRPQVIYKENAPGKRPNERTAHARDADERSARSWKTQPQKGEIGTWAPSATAARTR